MISFLLFWRAEDFFYQKVFNDPIIFPVTYSINNVKQRKCSVNKDDETISCPQGTNISNSAFVTATINNLPSGYFNILNFTCNSLKANPKQEIQIIIRSNGTGRSYFFKPDGSEQSNPVIPIVNNSQIEAYFLSHEGESIFKLPQLKIINPNIERKEYGKPKLTKIEKNVYRASVEVTPTEKLYIQSMFISNSFGLPKTMYEYNYPIPDSKTNVMIIPVIANESIIIGIDVYNDEYFCAWHQRTDVEGSYMELSIKPKRTFTLTYLIIEKESVNLRDSLEKWHLTFKDIYCNNTFGLGAWVAFPRLNQFKEDYIKPFMAKYIWGSELPKEKSFGLPTFYYVEPTLFHDESINCDASYEENINKCAANGSQLCTVIRDYGRRDINGKLQCSVNYNNKGSQIYFLFYGAARDLKLDSLFKALDKKNFTGVALDSLSVHFAFYNTNMPTEYCPFTLLDDKNYDKEFLITTQFNVFRNLSKYSPSGYMINTWIGFPQYTKWAAMLGYEVNIEKIFSSDFLYFWQTRIALGSRPISHLQLAGSWDKFEEYFSYCSVVGCTPSSEIGGFWNKDENMNKVKPTYDKWREPLMEMLNETTFLANGGGKVKLVNDEWGVFCKKDGTCYASFAIRNESTDYIATVDKNPECFFVPEGVTCKTDGNNVTISSKNKYRSAIIKFDGVVLEEKSKVGLIVGLTIFFVVLIAVIIAVVFVLIKMKKTKESNNKGEPGEKVLMI